MSVALLMKNITPVDSVQGLIFYIPFSGQGVGDKDEILYAIYDFIKHHIAINFEKNLFTNSVD